MDIIIISSRELTGNLHKPLILVNYEVGSEKANSQTF